MATLSAPNLESLIREVRIFLGQRKEANSRWKDDELALYLNDGIRQYFLELQKVAEGQFDTTTTLNIVSGVETITLPSDCFTVKTLYRVENGTNYILPYKNNFNESYDTSGVAGSNPYRPYYYFRGNYLVLRPAPAFSETGGLLLEYTQFPDDMITGNTTMPIGISPIFKELVVKYAVYQAKIQESSVMGTNTYSAIEAHLADLYNNFKHAISERSKYPQTIKPYNPE